MASLRVSKISNPQAFKWGVRLFKGDSRAVGIIFIRYVTDFPGNPRTTAHVTLRPETLNSLQTYDGTKSLLLQNFLKFPYLRSCINLDEFSASMAEELVCNFHYSPKFFDTRDGDDLSNTLIIFLNLRIDSGISPEIQEDISSLSVGEIEECLKACPKIGDDVYSNSEGLEEIEPAIKPLKVCCEDGNDEEMCSICLGELDEKKCVGTCCSHVFHDACISEWLIKGKSSCPLCRSSFYVQMQIL